MLSRDPTTVSPLKARSPNAFAYNPALCELCNTSLALDDSVLESCVETSDSGDLYIGQFTPPRTSIHAWNYAVFGGMNYSRQVELPHLAELSKESCQFCAALKEGLETNYKEISSWKHHPVTLSLCIQFSWTVVRGRTDLNSVVVSVFNTELEQWERGVFEFLVFSPAGSL